MPGNRIGFNAGMSLAQLKITQEVITLVVFVPFALIVMEQPLKLDFLWAGLCLVGAGLLRVPRRMSDALGRYRHIAIEGPIGAGKTTLAGMLADRLGAALMLEQPAENPFLWRFYQDRAGYAFQTQLFFLFQREKQMRSLAQPSVFAQAVVSDFMFAKDALFARLNSERRGIPPSTRHAPAHRRPSRARSRDLAAGLVGDPARARPKSAASPPSIGIDLGYLERLRRRLRRASSTVVRRRRRGSLVDAEALPPASSGDADLAELVHALEEASAASARPPRRCCRPRRRLSARQRAPAGRGDDRADAHPRRVASRPAPRGPSRPTGRRAGRSPVPDSCWTRGADRQAASALDDR